MAAPVKKQNCQKIPLLLEFAVACVTLAYVVQAHKSIISSTTTVTAISFTSTHVKGFSFAESSNVQQDKQPSLQVQDRDTRCLLTMLILLAGDIQMNPGPGNRSVFPCGACEIPVTWSQEGVCCNNCSVWYHV